MHPNDLITKHFRLNDIQKKALTRIGLATLEDLLLYFPTRYSQISAWKHIADVTVGEHVTICGKVTSTGTRKGWKNGTPIGEATVEDITGEMNIIWFNQVFLAKKIKVGDIVEVTGKVTEGTHGVYIANPEIQERAVLPIDTHDSLFNGDETRLETFGFPIYPETRGLTSKWMYHAVHKMLGQGVLDHIPETIPEDILKRYNLPSRKTALVWIHMPKKESDAQAARKRFAFEEVFFIQLARQQERQAYQSLFSYILTIPHSDIEDFISRFPFTPTDSPMHVIDTVLNDLKKDIPMSRLIEGDVGSGKTFVAATIAYAVIKNRPFDLKKNQMQTFGSLQVAYMAPTEVLATQLFENFIEYFKHTGISIALITGSGCRKFPTKVASSTKDWTEISRTQLLKWIKNGEIPIVIGTHALIQKSVGFKHLGLVIIDEQHRFGTAQRMKLAKKESDGRQVAPHYLSMTATPIPRTLALTIYGDLDLSVIDQMPSGRKPVITEIVPPNKRDGSYEKIRKELEAGRQAYIICPRIDEPDPDQEKAIQVKSVLAEAKRLKEIVFPTYRIDVMHSKMTPKKKDEVMKAFANHEIDILVSTSVIEVGVSVPNATNIIIEGAERFGLAQLHQLRGRVIRGNHQAYCYLFADAKSDKTTERLQAIVKAKNGFELAELDLGIRGAGELGGDKQWGVSDIGMEAIKNIKMVEASRTEAIAIITEDPTLAKHRELATILEAKKIHTHME